MEDFWKFPKSNNNNFVCKLCRSKTFYIKFQICFSILGGSKDGSVPGISKGVGFIRFDQRVEAERAIAKLNGTIPEVYFYKSAYLNFREVSTIYHFPIPRVRQSRSQSSLPTIRVTTPRRFRPWPPIWRPRRPGEPLELPCTQPPGSGKPATD